MPLDVLLMGSLDATPRPPAEVWQEFGLFKEEQPVLLAGYVEIVRGRVTALLDEPYTGLPASAIRALSGPVDADLTIENLATFHSAAKRDADQSRLVIYTAGMPSLAWRQMYQRLLSSLPPKTPISHWGDVDEDGFRIAATLAKTAAETTLQRMKHFADLAGWTELTEAVSRPASP